MGTIGFSAKLGCSQCDVTRLYSTTSKTLLDRMARRTRFEEFHGYRALKIFSDLLRPVRSPPHETTVLIADLATRRRAGAWR